MKKEACLNTFNVRFSGKLFPAKKAQNAVLQFTTTCSTVMGLSMKRMAGSTCTFIIPKLRDVIILNIKWHITLKKTVD